MHTHTTETTITEILDRDRWRERRERKTGEREEKGRQRREEKGRQRRERIERQRRERREPVCLEKAFDKQNLMSECVVPSTGLVTRLTA